MLDALQRNQMANSVNVMGYSKNLRGKQFGKPDRFMD